MLISIRTLCAKVFILILGNEKALSIGINCDQWLDHIIKRQIDRIAIKQISTIKINRTNKNSSVLHSSINWKELALFYLTIYKGSV